MIIILAIMAASIMNMYTKENPKSTSHPPSNLSAPAAPPGSNPREKRQEASMESLYGYDAPWSSEVREIALAFGSDDWSDRLQGVVPDNIVNDVSNSDWPRGTQPILDTVNDIDDNIATKVEFQEGWSLYIIVDIDHETENWSISRLEYGTR